MPQFRYRRMSTAEANALVLSPGRVVKDTEAGALRLYDGATPGGSVIQGSPVEFPAPGPQALVGGDETLGFYGEAVSGDLIDGETLATETGFTAGTPYYTDTSWLKFALDGKTLFVAKKPVRHSLSWNQLNAANLIHGDTVLDWQGRTYRVRVLTGGDADPASTVGGEWNQLMYRVHVDGPVDTHWETYTNSQIHIGSTRTARATFCQERTVNGEVVARGTSITYFNTPPASRGSDAFGWRPVLELIA